MGLEGAFGRQNQAAEALSTAMMRPPEASCRVRGGPGGCVKTERRSRGAPTGPPNQLNLFRCQPAVHNEAEAAPAAFVDGDAGVSLAETALQQDQTRLEVFRIFGEPKRRVEAELAVGELGAAVPGVLACDLPQDRTASRSRPLSFTSRPT
jgi:hypothetical protein